MAQNLSINEVETAFFEAMVEGWAAGAEPKSTPWDHSIVFMGNVRFWVRDSWITDPNGIGDCGRIVIWLKGSSLFSSKPVWVMQYGGYYDEAVISFLKAALMESYSSGLFYGGRGPYEFSDDQRWPGLKYRNIVERNSFGGFWGWEQIECGSGISAGHHHYHGGKLRW